jgi:subtilase family serine protease
MVPGHVPPVLKSLTSTGRLPGTNWLNLAIGLPLRNPAGLSNLLQQIYDPTSPNFHHYLTPEEFTSKFGPTEGDYQAVLSFARANHLQVTTTHPNRVLLDVSGSAAEVEQALHLTLHTYRHPSENRTVYAPDREPSLDLSVPVLHISGLDNYALPRPHLHATRIIPGQNASRNAGSGPSGTYMGLDFRAAYVPDSPLNGSG